MTRESMEFDVIIVGGGPAGLSAAIRLAQLGQQQNTPMNIGVLDKGADIGSHLLSVGLHELGHAFATKAFGYEVHYMGVGWYWFTPVAFTDTSDMWLSTRGPRTVVNLAGVYVNIIVASISALFIYATANAYLQGFLWLFALYAYLGAFRMLSPLQELDGYYVLMDLLDKPHLRQSAVMWLVKGLPKAIRDRRFHKENVPELCYWLACTGYLILVVCITLLLQSFVFNIIGIHSNNIVVSLALPFLVVLISSLNIIADVRSHAEE